MEFLLASKVALNKAGYLVSNTSNKPVTHDGWVKEQKAAEYFVKLAEAIKDKDFSVKQTVSLDSIKREVLNSINESKTVKYVDAPTKPVSAVNDELVNYALQFADFEKDKEKSKKINTLLQEFNVINDVEKVGEYFSEGLVKLNKIYTIEEIIAAAKIHVDKNI